MRAEHRRCGPLARLTAAALAGALGTVAPAGAQNPMSAIDWLSRSVATPSPPAEGVPAPDDSAGLALDPGPIGGLIAREIEVAPLDAPRLDAVGLLPAERAGLPRDLWGMSPAAELAAALARLGPDTLPALQQLLLALMVAELDPPRDAGAADDATLLLARLDGLTGFGALDQALALAEAAGPATPALFARWFDLALLGGDTAPVCDALRARPELSDDVAQHIYCRARGGDWAGADALLASPEAEALPAALRAALLRFLDPEAEADTASPIDGAAITPLAWQLADALGETVPTAGLPLAYARADLGPAAGWKAQLEAAERLTQSGALTPNRLLGLYTERAPAASGGVWERVRAMQRLEAALLAQDVAAVAEVLPQAWALMLEVQLETAFAALYAERLLRLELPPEAARLAWRAALLAGVPATPRIESSRDAFLQAVAAGELGPDWPGPDWQGPGWPDTATSPPGGAIPAAVAEGLRADPDAAAQALLDEARRGELLLRALERLQGGGAADPVAVAEALMQLRAAGQVEVARRTALQILLLDRRG